MVLASSCQDSNRRTTIKMGGLNLLTIRDLTRRGKSADKPPLLNHVNLEVVAGE